MQGTGRLWPKLSCRDGRSLSHGLELRPYDTRIDARGTCEGAESTVRAGDYVLTANEFRETHDSLCDEAWVLYEIAQRIDDAGDEDLSVGQS